MDLEAQLKSGRATLKLLSKDINQIYRVGKSIVEEKDTKLLESFKAMFTRLSHLLNEYMQEFKTCQALAFNDGKESLFPLEDDFEKRSHVNSLYYKAVEYYQSIERTHEKCVDKTLNQSLARTRLPQIILPTFSGVLGEFPKFKQLFESMVNSNDEIPVIEKFHYLSSALVGDPKTLISTFTICEANYDKAWKALVKRYDNKRLLATSYIEKILDYPHHRGYSNLASLQSFIRVVVENVSSLRTLDITQESDFILLTLALRKLDTETRQQFETNSANTEWPSFQQLVDFIQGRCTILQLSHSSSGETGKPYFISKSQSKPRVLTTIESHAHSSPSKGKDSVCFCKQKHALYDCPVFREKSPAKRRQFLKGKVVCFNCLTPSHVVKSCPSNGRCRVCKATHHTLLHDTILSKGPTTLEQSGKSSSASALPGQSGNLTCLRPMDIPQDPPNLPSPVIANVTGPAQVLLGTAEILIQNSEGVLMPVRLLLDCGSQLSLITSKCAKRLGLNWQATRHSPLGAGQTPLPSVKGKLKCKLYSRLYPERHLDAEPLVVGSITGDLPITQLNPNLAENISAHTLADPLFWKPRPIDFLLGNDLFMKTLMGCTSTTDGHCGSLSTIFGYILMGNTGFSLSGSNSGANCLCLTDSPISKELITRFWEMEEVFPQVKDVITDPCEEHFRSTHYRDPSGRYVVSLPFKHPAGDLTSSKALAMSRFHSLETRFRNNVHLKYQYWDFMSEYETLGHMNPTTSPSSYVIPHHAVFKNDPDAKIRVVFDSSMPTPNGSLNDSLHVGPKLQKDIAEIVLNFRRHPFAITADIVKMYRQILINPEDRKYQHILWRSDPNFPIQKFELNTVTYGMTSSPYLALRTIQQLGEDEGTQFPAAAKVLSRDIYVDDILTGADDLDEAISLKEELIGLLGKGKFTIHKWRSNSPEFLKRIDALDADNLLNFHSKESCIGRILGMSWDSASDKLFYEVKSVSGFVIKRSVLSVIARLYDPLGLLSPVIFKAKCFLQETWMSKVAWDDTLPASFKQEWLRFASQLPLLGNLRIPRYFLLPSAQSFQIIAFCDASLRGMAAALYLRVVSSSGEIKVSLIKAKTKLAPLKTVSIPRLELCAAHLLVKLVLSVQSFIQTIPVSDIYYFTDSMIVLSWLKISPHELQTFVANRVAFVITNSKLDQRFHTPSAENPADVASRGLSPEELDNYALWWAGPSWLHKSPIEFPESRFAPPQHVPELRKGVSLVIGSSQSWLTSWIQQYSHYGMMIRVLAYTTRYIYNLKARSFHRDRIIGPLSPNEIEKALMLCIKIIQRATFSEEFDWVNNRSRSKRLIALAAYLDTEGVIRVGGRLQHTNLPHEIKHPIIVPGNTHLMNIMIDYYHKIFYHLGLQGLIAFIRRKYWVFWLRQTIRSRISKCLSCYRLKAQPLSPFMGSLQHPRVCQARPFITVGIDFAGPFLIKLGARRSTQTHKAYLCLFVCFATKAVHLEAVSMLSTDAFFAALERFIARRGLPTKIYSDCGKNFVGAARKLKELFLWLKTEETQSKIQRHLLEKGIKWVFMPPYAPHFGGLWEAAVKSTKYHLCRVIGSQPLNFEELATIFSKIEAILNSRPLCPLVDDPSQEDYLTPGHFLIGAPLNALPERDLTHLKLNTLSRWQLLKNTVQHFWKRWHTEYLHSLQKRPKWYHHSKPLEVGNLVLLSDPTSSPQSWKMARIIELHPGEDGVVRVVTLKDHRNTYRRAVHKLVSLSHLSEPEGQLETES